MKILDAPLQISSLEEQQKITERPAPAWFTAEKKVTTVMKCLFVYVVRLHAGVIGILLTGIVLWTGFRKTRVFLKKPNPGGFFGFYWVLGFIGDFWTRSASGCLNKHGNG